MDKKELLLEEVGKRIYATDEPMIRWVEFVGEYADFCTTMHSFLMKGLADQELTCNFCERLSETEIAVLKVLEIPMTLTVVNGGEEPAYAYYLHREGGEVPATRDELLDGTVIEEALLNMEDTGRYVWDVLHGYFANFGITLGQIDLRFGHVAEHFIVLCGDLTPETMHLFDPETGKRLWNGEGGMEHAYDIIKARLTA